MLITVARQTSVRTSRETRGVTALSRSDDRCFLLAPCSVKRDPHSKHIVRRRLVCGSSLSRPRCLKLVLRLNFRCLLSSTSNFDLFVHSQFGRSLRRSTPLSAQASRRSTPHGSYICRERRWLRFFRVGSAVEEGNSGPTPVCVSSVASSSY